MMSQVRNIESALCPYELSSIRSMTSYIAQRYNLQEKNIECLVTAQFGVSSLAQLRHEDFRRAIAFLIDLKFEGLSLCS